MSANNDVDGAQGRTEKKAEAQDTFIEVLAATGNVSEAARAAGVGRRRPYKWKEADPGFADRWADAREEAADALEGEARRRAADGVEEPVFYRGEVCGTVRRYSDTLLIFLLKGLRPDKYRERRELTGTAGGPVQIIISELDAKL